LDLLPLKATFAPGEPISLEVVAAEDATVSVYRREQLVAEERVTPAHTLLELEPLPVGGYGVECTGGARTAFDVLPLALARPRYGFVSCFERGRDVAPVVRNARALHLNAIQFYDWMYRHADLVPATEDYEDPLGRPLSLGAVRALARELAAAGSVPVAYAAVYAVGHDEWPRWAWAGLERSDGTPWTLGDDFLRIVDPSEARWLDHFTADLRRAVDACGFAGFHLDQYGDPKRALRGDGTAVDLAVAFVELIQRVRHALPDAALIFNNVNNYPVWATADAAQDAVYIEVWPPHTGLDHLARLIRDARPLARDKPVILAAYLSVFGTAAEAEALHAARLTMATIFSHGAFHLLAGEAGAVLTDPYYVRHHEAGPETRAVLRRWYDFAVRYGDLLYDTRAIDVTTAITGGVNEELLLGADAPVEVDPAAGAIWMRTLETTHGLVVHLIDLRNQQDLDWDAPKRSTPDVGGVRLSIRRGGQRASTVHVASPEALPALTRVRSSFADGYDVYELPAWRTWLVALVRS
jgi:dextranase